MSDDPPHTEKAQTSRLSSPSDTVLALEFAAEAGKLMLESSPSVSEVLDRLRRFLPLVGLDGCAVDGTLSMLTLSYWTPDQPLPLTTMREVKVSRPRLEQLSGALSLLNQVERGEIDLRAAFERLEALEDAQGQSRVFTNAAVLVGVGGWAIFLNGFNATTVLVALLATLFTFPIGSIVARLRLPLVAGTFLAALVLDAVPNLLAGAGLSFSVGAAVVAGLYAYLPGRALVSSVIDGLANAPVSAISRGLEAILAAGAIALGIVASGKIGAGLGVIVRPDPIAVPLAIAILGAAVGVLGLSSAWGMPRRRLGPTVTIAAFGWVIVAVLTRLGGGNGWLEYLLAAVFVGFCGVIIAYFQGGAASVYTGVAILPLVPGFSLYRGMLALAQGNDALARSSLQDAVTISLAVAGGVAIGLALGRNTLAARAVVTARRPNR